MIARGDWLLAGTISASASALNGTIFSALGVGGPEAAVGTALPLATFGLAAGVVALDREIETRRTGTTPSAEAAK